MIWIKAWAGLVRARPVRAWTISRGAKSWARTIGKRVCLGGRDVREKVWRR